MRKITILIALLICFGIEKSITEAKFLTQKTGNAIYSDPKEAAFKVLNTKCNVCHRKKNPFKVFSPKNMGKHAQKIYQQVFVLKRMPKGEEIKLTEEEYCILKNWLATENIF